MITSIEKTFVPSVEVTGSLGKFVSRALSAILNHVYT
jgi:hypothetical protein